jgi:hypothetical protein
MLVIGVLAWAGVAVRAQVAMPDPSQISGVPLPDASVPSGTVSVRVIRGSFANNLSGVDVTFTIDGKTKTVKTDQAGRAQVVGLPKGARVTAATVVSGERLESQEITIADSGIRFVLAASDPEAAARAAEDKSLAAGPAVKGGVVLAGDSRVIAEFSLDRLNIYYLMAISNTARTPVDIGGPLVFDLPRSARGAALMDDSTKQATVNGSHVTVVGPFAPGTTHVNIEFELPYDGPTAHIEQRWPAPIEASQVFALKTGALDIQSPQLTQKQSAVEQGQPIIVAMGPGLAAGQPFTLDIINLPYHARWPRFLALGLAAVIALAGIRAAVTPGAPRAAARG